MFTNFCVRQRYRWWRTGHECTGSRSIHVFTLCLSILRCVYAVFTNSSNLWLRCVYSFYNVLMLCLWILAWSLNRWVVLQRGIDFFEWIQIKFPESMSEPHVCRRFLLLLSICGFWDPSKKTRAGNTWKMAVLARPELSWRADWWTKRWIVKTSQWLYFHVFWKPLG